MAQLNKTSWKNLYGLLGTIFPDNTTSEISEGDMRTFGENMADSFLNRTDDLLDEDDMASDSPTAVPSQQSVKAYVASSIGGLVKARITIPAASVLTSFASPVSIVAAPGAGKGIIVQDAVITINFNSAAYATNTNGRLQIGGLNTVAVFNINVAGDTFFLRPSLAIGGTSITNIENTALVFTVDTANPTDGDSDIIIDVLYRIVDI